MKLYEQIRKAHDREQLSIHELARRFHVHRRDVRQALASAVPPERKRPERPAPSLDQWKPTIDGWLAADRLAPRKQRHTARQVGQRLSEEHEVLVGESTVRRYVAEVRRHMDVPRVEVMVPLEEPQAPWITGSGARTTWAGETSVGPWPESQRGASLAQCLASQRSSPRPCSTPRAAHRL